MRRLAGEPRLRVWRQNTGALPDRNGRLVHFGIRGGGDLSGILDTGQRLEIECKSPAGKQSKAQAAFERMVRKYGGVYVLARSVRDVEEALASWLTPPTNPTKATSTKKPSKP